MSSLRMTTVRATCRIGMEDTVHLSKGIKTPGNGALVEKAVRIIDELGGRVATGDEARKILEARKVRQA